MQGTTVAIYSLCTTLLWFFGEVHLVGATGPEWGGGGGGNPENPFEKFLYCESKGVSFLP